MDHQKIIEVIIAVYTDILEQQKKPLMAEEIENGYRYVWMLEGNMKFTLDQYDNPPNSDYKIESEHFTLILKEDNENEKYYLDAPILKNEDHLGAWLGSMWMKYKGVENL